MTEMLLRSGLGIGALGPEIRDGSRLLQRQAGRHDLPHQAHTCIAGYRPLVAFSPTTQDFSVPVRAVKDAVVNVSFSDCDLLGTDCALVQQTLDFFVQLVYSISQLIQGDIRHQRLPVLQGPNRQNTLSR